MLKSDMLMRWRCTEVTSVNTFCYKSKAIASMSVPNNTCPVLYDLPTVSIHATCKLAPQITHSQAKKPLAHHCQIWSHLQPQWHHSWTQPTPNMTEWKSLFITKSFPFLVQVPIPCTIKCFYDSSLIDWRITIQRRILMATAWDSLSPNTTLLHVNATA